MRIKLIAVGNKMPAWVQTAFSDYQKRLRPNISLDLIEINGCQSNQRNDQQRVLNKEGEQILKAIKADEHVLALDVAGTPWSSQGLAHELALWKQDSLKVTLIIGGAEGLSPACLQRSQQRWSLSKLTFPHQLVRIIISEQLYRAECILKNHPYHK
jgi:23S rRNA (pseudouridine1915-N3)-methyltransferase